MMQSTNIMNKALESSNVESMNYQTSVKNTATRPPKAIRSTDGRMKHNMRRSLVTGASAEELTIDVRPKDN